MSEGLQIDDLRVARGRAIVLDQVSLSVSPGETVALVGESGAGKTTLMQAVLGRLPDHVRITNGSVRVDGIHTNRLAPRDHAAFRLSTLGYVPQEPGSALDPFCRIRHQLHERLMLAGVPRHARDERATTLLRRAGIPDPDRILPLYPHQISGGYRQRALIAIALAGHPTLLLADEATSALDPETREEVLDQLAAHATRHRAATLLVTHDMGIATRRADRIVVLADGRVTETIIAHNSRFAAVTPYTRALIEASPELNPRLRAGPAAPSRPEETDNPRHPAVELRSVTRRYSNGAPALDRVSLRVEQGKTTALIGRSGSGKSTLARLALALDAPDDGEVLWNGVSVRHLSPRELRRQRGQVQYVAQDPWDSLDPRRSVSSLILEPLLADRPSGRAKRKALLVDTLDQVGLPSSLLHRRPRELSGGQRQRVAIARALISRPTAIVLDEPTSALDTITQARILALLVELQRECGVAYLLISHDIATVAQLADRTNTLEQGRIISTVGGTPAR